MKILTVPMKVDAFVADNVTTAVTTNDDFSQLPFCDEEKKDINFGVANLSSSIASKTFDSSVSLETGIHLHWSLPDALGKGDSIDGNLVMPSVPNRWMVVRVHKTGDTPNKSWIVESDYLYPTFCKKPKRAVCIPNEMKNKSHDGSAFMPYRYLGRQLELSQWLADANASDEHITQLNVLGWGSPYFSALYTNCQSVFGAYDAEVSGEDAANYTYEIYGWYAESQEDYVTKVLNSGAGDDLISNAQTLADWVVDGDTEASGMLCYGKVDFSSMAEDYANAAVDTANTKISFAKSPYESVAAYLAKQGDSFDAAGSSTALENQIQAILFNDDLSGTNIDFIDKLKNARHKDGFVPVNSGSLWAFIDESALFTGESIAPEEKADAKERFATFQTAHGAILDDLNQLQEQQNRSRHSYQHSLRLLYNDWSKYMLSLHPSDTDSHSAANSGHIRYLIERNTLPQLEAHKTQMASLAADASARNTQLQRLFIDEVSQQQTGLSTQPLIQVPGPRYWQPGAPSLLIAGDVVKQSNRYGDESALACQVVDFGDVLPIDWLQVAANRAALDWPARAVNAWSQQPWSPLLIEWRMGLYADSDAKSDVIANQKSYNADFITSNYRIPLNDNEYSLPSAAVDLQLNEANKSIAIDDAYTMIKGRSLLTFSGKGPVVNKFDDFVEHYTGDTSASVFTDMKQAGQFLEETPCAMPSLDDFHNELLMYSNSTMLNVEDPSQFKPQGDFEESLTERVKAALHEQHFKLPSFGHRFSPIKNGLTKLSSLHVVDTFGRFESLDCKNVIRPQKTVVGDTIYSPPRVVQPLRLLFRWQNIVHAEQSASPICGWLCYNLFDETLAVYSPKGDVVGAINADGEWVDAYGLIQGLGAANSAELNTFIIKVLSFHPRNRIVESAFTALSSDNHWKQLVDAAVLIPFGDGSKAYLKPLTEEQWPATAGIGFSDAQALFLQSQAASNHFPSLKKAILRAQDNIEPEFNHQLIEGVALKPLAIVKANLDLQLMGEPEVDKSWSAMKHDLTSKTRSDRQFTQVKFPIKLGEYNNLDDGLVAYWRVEGKGLSQYGYFPQSDMADIEGFIDAASFDNTEDDYIDQTQKEGVDNLTQALADQATTVLMLMDPEGDVHATTGIVPRKTLKLDTLLYKDAVENIQPNYFTAPLLTPKDSLSVPLPLQKNWSWHQQKMADGEQQTQTLYSLKVVDKSAFVQCLTQTGSEPSQATIDRRQADWATLVAEKVLVETGTDTGKAYCHDVDLSEKGFTDVEDVIRCIDGASLGGILPTESVNPLDNRVRVVEGWLRPLNLD